VLDQIITRPEHTSTNTNVLIRTNCKRFVELAPAFELPPQYLKKLLRSPTSYLECGRRAPRTHSETRCQHLDDVAPIELHSGGRLDGLGYSSPWSAARPDRRISAGSHTRFMRSSARNRPSKSNRPPLASALWHNRHGFVNPAHSATPSLNKSLRCRL
jgi:hypothetical protein